MSHPPVLVGRVGPLSDPIAVLPPGTSFWIIFLKLLCILQILVSGDGSDGEEVEHDGVPAESTEVNNVYLQ